MTDLAAVVACRARGVSTHGLAARLFPPPRSLRAYGAGVDISDNSVKWLALKQLKRGWQTDVYGHQSLEQGIVDGGVVRDPVRLAAAIDALREKVGGGVYAHAALPEETAYIFNMHVPDIYDRAQTMNMIEFELEGRVPLTAQQAVFDYEVVNVHSDEQSAEIGVMVFPRDVVEGYVEAFAQSSTTLLSLEIEARSIARAVVAHDTTETVLMADFGRARTGIAVLKRGVPIFTSTVPVGGSIMTSAVVEALGVTEEEAETVKNEQGLVDDMDNRASEAIIGTATSLADEIARHFSYWDTRSNEHGERVTPIGRVVLCGGSANLRGLPELIASKVKARTERANAWKNVCDFRDWVPPIHKRYSLGYATAIGLALRGVS